MNSQTSQPGIKGDVIIEKQFIYGTCSFWQGKKAVEEKQHKWTVYVRGLENEDMSYFIQKVQFALHESFSVPKRVIERPPYEATEYGWGEFAIGIKVYFRDPALPPVDLWHSLKLFPQNGGPSSMRKPVQVERYDEFVFKNPSEAYRKMLEAGPQKMITDHRLKQYFKTNVIADEEQKQILKLTKARQKILQQIQSLQFRYKTAKDDESRYVKRLTEFSTRNMPQITQARNVQMAQSPPMNPTMNPMQHPRPVNVHVTQSPSMNPMQPPRPGMMPQNMAMGMGGRTNGMSQSAALSNSNHMMRGNGF